MGAIFSQFFFIPEAPITEKNCPDQSDRVRHIRLMLNIHQYHY